VTTTCRSAEEVGPEDGCTENLLLSEGALLEVVDACLTGKIRVREDRVGLEDFNLLRIDSFVSYLSTLVLGFIIVSILWLDSYGRKRRREAV
jgi:hypothetical protein